MGVDYPEKIIPQWKEELGFDNLDRWSFFLGVYYPLPNRYLKLSTRKKYLWKAYCHMGDILTLLLFISNLGGLIVAYHNVAAFVTCLGTLTYIICFWIELLIYRKKEKTLKSLSGFFYKISWALQNNPVGDKTFLQIHYKYINQVLVVGKGKLGVTIVGVCLLGIIENIIKLQEEVDENRNLPMFGWYPYDTRKRHTYFLTVLFQFVAYLSFLLKDVVLDCFCLTILVIINTHLIYLKYLFGLLANDTSENETKFSNAQKKEIFRWWVTHHQMILKSVVDLREITSIYLLCKYTCVIVILFLGAVLVTTEREYDWMQQLIIFTLNSSNLFQLYIFSIVGNEITQNGLQLTEFGFHLNLIYNKNVITTEYIFIAARCSKPIFIRFGKIHVLSVASFAKILKVTFSYLITTVQIRGKSIENTNNYILFQNSTTT